MVWTVVCTKGKQYGTRNSKAIASCIRQWRHLNSKDNQVLAKVTIYNLVSNCSHLSAQSGHLLQSFGHFVVCGFFDLL